MRRMARQRAPRREGHRTTIRIPDDLAEEIERLAAAEGISKNDALLQLAAEGAALHSRKRLIQDRAKSRRKALITDESFAAHITDERALPPDYARFVTPEEASEAVMEARRIPPADAGDGSDGMSD